MRDLRQIKKLILLSVAACLIGFYSLSLAVESDNYRLLSISQSEKLILASKTPNKTKYLLDVSSAKITIDGHPGELKELQVYSTIQVKMKLKKSKRNGIKIDGSATEIRVQNPAISQ